MPKYMKNFITLAGLIIIGSFLAFLYNCIVSLSGFVGQFSPTLQPWVFWALFLSVTATLGWMAAMAFMRPKPMMVYADPTEEDMAAFRQELLRRLKKNRHLRDAEVVINDEADLETGLAYLRDQADQEIRATAKRVFIGTGISQNGRLDSLVVLFLISRLTWRIAKLYNQRPHYREMINLFANIGATSFLAGSIEEFGIEEYVHELMGPLIGGSAIGAVPGAQAIAGTITTSVLDGTTNSLLTLRCGIVARDYLSLSLDAKGAMRRSATVEASKVFMTMSAETVVYVTKTLVKGAAGAVKTGSTKAAKSVGNTISGTAGAVGNGAQKVGHGVKEAAGAVGDGVKSAAKAVGDGAKDAAGAVGGGAKKMGRGVKGAANTVGNNTKEAGRKVKHATDFIENQIRKTGQSMKKTVNTVTQNAGKGVDSTKLTTTQTVEKAKKASKTVIAEAGDATKKIKKAIKSQKSKFKSLSNMLKKND